MNDDEKIAKIADMTPEEKKDLASRMLNPIRCGGQTYDEQGRVRLILGGVPRTPKEVNDIIRQMNPRWTDEQLKAGNHLMDEEDFICK